MLKPFPSMKWINLLLILFVSGRLMMAGTYFVATTGNDTNEGTSIDMPFASIARAVSLAEPGDTIFVRGGVYQTDKKIGISRSGLPGEMIRLWAFPGEKPLLDFSGLPEGNTDRGINLNARYWHIRGLEVANAGDNGLIIDSGHFNIIERCTFRNNGDTGLQISGGSAYNEVINCDSYFNEDLSYENADGFAAKIRIGSGNRFVGCRAWNNADDGWDLYEGDRSVEIHYCLAFRNGYLEDGSPAVPNGDMNGFKLGGNSVAGDHLVTHSIAFHNGSKGFDQNNNSGVITLLNNTAWMNGTYYSKPNFNFPRYQNIFKNNISFQGADEDRLSAGESSNNSWQGFDVDSADFVSMDPQLASSPRQANGNLPENGFLQLVPGNDMSDAGTDVGFPYAGLAPDVGAKDTDNEGSGISYVTLVSGRSAQGICQPSSMLFPLGTELSVEAVPFDGYLFKEWQGSVNSTANPLMVTAETNLYLEPLFMEDTSSVSIGPEQDADLGLSLFPNPALEWITLSISSSFKGEGTVLITDLFGKVVLMKGIRMGGQEKEIEVSSLPEGVYILAYYTQGLVAHLKFLKQ